MNSNNNTAANKIAKLIERYSLEVVDAVGFAPDQATATHAMIMGLSCLSGIIASFEAVNGEISEGARKVYEITANGCAEIIEHRTATKAGYEVSADTPQEAAHKGQAAKTIDFLCRRPDHYPDRTTKAGEWGHRPWAPNGGYADDCSR